MEALTGGALLPPIQRHGHWDCSRGINCSTMLEACLDAWTNMMISNEEVTGMDVIQYILRDLFPSSAETVSIQLERDPTLVFHIQWRNPDHAPDLSFSNARNCFQESRLLAHTKSQALKVVDSLEKARTNDDVEDPQEDETYFSLHVACILWLWNQLQVQTVSITPLASQGVSLEALSLLTGMPINLNQTCRVMTPAAIAILKTLLADGNYKSLTCCPPLTLEATGVSEGTAGFSVRLCLGIPCPPTTTPQSTSSIDNDNDNYPWNTDRLIHLQTNLDDISAEALAFAVEVLLDNGAADAWVAPIVMKKGRAAHTLHCLCRDELWTKLLHLVFQHTTTLGVRIQRHVERAALQRRFVTVRTPYSDQTRVDVKIGYLQGGQVLSVKAEFDHCKAIALETGIPISDIAASAVKEAMLETTPAD